MSDPKPRPDLIPGAALLEVGRALELGLHIHRTREESPSVSDRVASAMRHMCACIGDHTALDDRSGLPHITSAATQLLLAIGQMKDGSNAGHSVTSSNATDTDRHTVVRVHKGWAIARDHNYPDGPSGYDAFKPGNPVSSEKPDLTGTIEELIDTINRESNK